MTKEYGFKLTNTPSGITMEYVQSNPKTGFYREDTIHNVTLEWLEKTVSKMEDKGYKITYCTK